MDGETVDLAAWAAFSVQLILAASVPIGIVAITVHRIMTGKGIGLRALQFLGVGVLVPLAAVLGLQGVLEPSALAAIFGGVVGYLFAQTGAKED